MSEESTRCGHRRSGAIVAEPLARILLVDDEPQSLAALKVILCRLGRSWTIETALGGKAGCDRLASESFSMVITDNRMPDYSGDEVLAFARIRSPQTIRVVLSGQAEPSSAYRLVGEVHRFLAKPCCPDTVRKAIREMTRAVERFEPDTRALILSGGPMPLSAASRRLLEPDADITTVAPDRLLASFVESPGLVWRALQLTTSAFSGLPRDVIGVDKALYSLPYPVLQMLVDASASAPQTLTPEGEKPAVSAAELGLAVQRIAERLAITHEGLLLPAVALVSLGAVRLSKFGKKRRHAPHTLASGNAVPLSCAVAGALLRLHGIRSDLADLVETWPLAETGLGLALRLATVFAHDYGEVAAPLVAAPQSLSAADLDALRDLGLHRFANEASRFAATY